MRGEALFHALAARRRRATTFTVMLPVTRPPLTLSCAVRSVLAQQFRDFELCIILDGAPLRTVALALLWKLRDRRVRVFVFPKGERHGESHRAAVLEGSNARFVAQLGDDDLWFPNHLGCLAERLETVDLVSLRQFRIMPGGWTRTPPAGDLADRACIRRMLEHTWNFFGPTEAGYRLDAYRKLPVGWSPAPANLPTDLFMWRKFLSFPGLVFATAQRATSLKFGASEWRQVRARRLLRAMRRYGARLDRPGFQAAVQARVNLCNDPWEDVASTDLKKSR